MMPREKWISRNAGYSPALISFLESFTDLDISDEAELKILQAINDNRIWCIPYANTVEETALEKNGKALYKIIEVCRRYGQSVVTIPTINFASLAYIPHPWIDTGNYLQAVVDTDLVIAEGIYPNPQEHMDDWKALQLAFSQRVTGKYKPSIFLDANFKNLPVVQQSINSRNFVKEKGQK